MKGVEGDPSCEKLPSWLNEEDVDSGVCRARIMAEFGGWTSDCPKDCIVGVWKGDEASCKGLALIARGRPLADPPPIPASIQPG